MSWNQNEYDEVTKALEATLDERPAKGKLTPIKSFNLAGLVQFFEQRARTAPESLPEAPWQRNVNSSPKCNCGKCGGAGWIYVDGKAVKFCNARSSRSDKSKELGEAESDRNRFDLGTIFQERG
jgi:hypothetical protein